MREEGERAFPELRRARLQLREGELIEAFPPAQAVGDEPADEAVRLAERDAVHDELLDEVGGLAEVALERPAERLRAERDPLQSPAMIPRQPSIVKAASKSGSLSSCMSRL